MKLTERAMLEDARDRPGYHTARRPWRAFNPAYRMAWRLWWQGKITIPVFGVRITPAGRAALEQKP